jgi:hypothetical protein
MARDSLAFFFVAVPVGVTIEDDIWIYLYSVYMR